MMQSVYVALSADRVVKIGRTINLSKRIERLRVEWPGEWRLIYHIPPHPNNSRVETSAHRILRRWRIAGREWFRCDPSTAVIAVELAAHFVSENKRLAPQHRAERRERQRAGCRRAQQKSVETKRLRRLAALSV